jgi:flagellin-like protein
MHARRTERNDRGVSPVIGVILMVAITVLLAATVATFFIGLGDTAEQYESPTAAFEFDYGNERGGGQVLSIQHVSGDTLRRANVRFTLSDARCVGGPVDPNGRYRPATLGVTSTQISAGVTARIDSALCSSGDLVLRSASVDVVWISPEGQNSNKLIGWDGPDA